MESEQQLIKHINIDIEQRSVTFLTGQETGVKFSLAKAGLIMQTLFPSINQERSVEKLIDEIEDTTEEFPENKQETMVLKGRIKGKVAEGRPDGSGRPTAYARFAAHEEGRPEAHMYLATFHRHTRDIVMQMNTAMQLEVEGYPHESTTPDRLDTLSVIRCKVLGPPTSGRR